MNIENSKNVNTGEINSDGHVIIGDGNNITIIHLKEAADYKELQEELEALNEQFKKTQSRIEKYPEEAEFKLELLEISNKQNNVKEKIEQLKKAVVKLAEDFARISINTDRLELAKQFFEKGEFDKARAILDAEQMATELDALKGAQQDLSKRTEDNRRQLKDKANEFLILARLTAVEFSLPDRFEKTKTYFKQSLSAEQNFENVFGFAYFLQEHKQFIEALPLYEEVLRVYRELAQTNPQTYLPDVAKTLNNLGVLLKNINELPLAREAYEESLQIYRELAQINPKAYLPNVAMTLNNIGILLKDTNQLLSAREAYEEALQIGRELVRANPQAYLPDVAKTLNNFGILLGELNELPSAREACEEALQIRRELARITPQTYLPNVAATLNNLGILLKDINELPSARKAYEEALQVYRELARINPQAYLPDVAKTLNNLGNLLGDINELPLAREAYEEALQIRRELARITPQTYLPQVAKTLNNLGVLLVIINELPAAREAYEEALQIRRELARDNPQTYLPDVAMTAINMSIFYLQKTPDKEKSLVYAKEAIKCAYPFSNIIHTSKKYIETAMQVAQLWEIDPDKFLEEAIRELK